MKNIFFILFCLFSVTTTAQESVKKLTTYDTAIITAFETIQTQNKFAPSTHFINSQKIQQTTSPSLVTLLNNVAGVRMEERSPNSYRLNIRGSSLRSPFGIRNVKIYFDNIPITEPSGSSYLNHFSINDIANITVLKGPTSSIYGVGNGGTLLLQSPKLTDQPYFSANLFYGSFNTMQLNLAVHNKNNFISFNHTSSNGYRTHTENKKTTLLWKHQIIAKANKSLQLNTFYSDLFYQTPGGLTQAEYSNNAKQARPRVGNLPSAPMAKAAIFQNMILLALQYKQDFSKKINNSTTIYANNTQIDNPTFRNYENRTEPHFGFRTVFTYRTETNKNKITINLGSENQKGNYTNKVFNNKMGRPDTLAFKDLLTPLQLSFFAQLTYNKGGFQLAASNSINHNKIIIQRKIPVSVNQWHYTSKWIAMPRMSAALQVNKSLAIFTAISKGFSPPTTAELLPGNTIINTTLLPEIGNNTEIGLRLSSFSKIKTELTIFNYNLTNAIVARKDISGADFFINAGNVNQKGMELNITYKNNWDRFWGSAFEADCSITNHFFRYEKFMQGNADYTKNFVPGIPKTQINANIFCKITPSIDAYINTIHQSKLFLNDANTNEAAAFSVLHLKMIYHVLQIKKTQLSLFVSMDNVTNQKYSIGNDINAIGGRYYNVAAERSINFGIKLIAKNS